jgi:U3 small nucleolar RNA-associated protein 12
MKSYYRYAPSGAMGVICAPEGPAIFDRTGKLAFTSAVESVGVWNLRQANQVCSLAYEDPGYPYADRGEVTMLALTDDHTTVCVGYSTGEVRLFNYVDKSLITTFRGHRSAISALTLNPMDRAVLASGSADCHIVLWDLVARNGLARLKGHKDMVTAIAFVSADNQQYLVSASKDTLVKVDTAIYYIC